MYSGDFVFLQSPELGTCTWKSLSDSYLAVSNCNLVLQFLKAYISWTSGWISDLKVKVTNLEILSESFWLKFFSTFLLWKQLKQIFGRTLVSLVTLTCGSWSEGQHDPYFTVYWFCLISWRLFDVRTSYFGIMSQYDPTCDLKINVGHCDLYFMVQWFCLIF